MDTAADGDIARSYCWDACLPRRGRRRGSGDGKSGQIRVPRVCLTRLLNQFLQFSRLLRPIDEVEYDIFQSACARNRFEVLPQAETYHLCQGGVTAEGTEERLL